jgi:Uma2 family endonuclease
MNVPPRYIPQYTVADYQQWPGDWDLLDGVPIAMGPSPFGPHGAMAARLAARFVAAVEEASLPDAAVLQEVDWVVDQHTVVRPDLVLVLGGIPQQYLLAPPVVAVEILSAGSQERDRSWKMELYQEQGVRYYLIADPTTTQIEIYQLQEGKYQVVECDGSFRFYLTESNFIEVALI